MGQVKNEYKREIFERQNYIYMIKSEYKDKFAREHHMKNKLLQILWWILFVLLMIGGGVGVAWELFPTIIPDSIFYPAFYAQWVIVPAFIILTVLKESENK